MRFDANKNYETLLREGIRAVRDGSMNLAWSLLNQAAQLNPYETAPWLWLTETTEDLAEKEEYLEKALAVEPTNIAARRGLQKLRGEAVAQPSFQEVNTSLQRQAAKPVFAKAKQTFLCPKCGAHLEYDLQTNALSCLYCGLVQEMAERSAADDEQVIARVLPTEQGHRWAAAQQQLVCGQCGAHSLWPAGQTAAECPYCGSRQLFVSEDTEGLVDPQGIAIMQVNEKQAADQIMKWLGKGWVIPDDLKESARKSLLRPAYYPFWTFDGILEVHWSCSVNESSRDENWVSRSGVEFEVFDDVLIPGLKAMKFKELNKLGKFYLKDVVEFSPDYLAGWPALTYDRSLAEATLLARERIIRKVRSELHFRVLPGSQKRDLETGGVNWQDMTFKHVLLPVWIGWYRYKGKDYPVMVNGQTGQVVGEKPRDTFKVVGIAAGILFTVIVLSLIGVIIASFMGWI